MTTLAGVILTHNEEEHIEACIESLRWTDSILVFDSYSADRTAALADAAGARILQHEFQNYAAQRDAALKAVDAEWVVFVDADERVSPTLAEEIQRKIEGPERGWWVPRHNYIFGRLTLGAGWYPDYQMRVLHRTSAHYDPDRPVHERVILDGPEGYLTNPLIHYNYRNRAQFIAKQERYTDIEARRRFDLRMIPKVYTPLTGAVREFVRRFITLRGFRDGLHGLNLCLLLSYYEFQTWLRVARLKREMRG